MADKRYRLVYIDRSEASGKVAISGPAGMRGWNPSHGCPYCQSRHRLHDLPLAEEPETYALVCPRCLAAVVVRVEWPRPQEDDPQLLKMIEEKLPREVAKLMSRAGEALLLYQLSKEPGQA